MFILAILSISTDAYVPYHEEWNRTFGGAENSYAYSVEETQDGGYIVAGSTISNGQDALLIKTYPNGELQWRRTFGGRYDDQARSVQQTRDGGFIIAGMITTSNIRFVRGRESPFGMIINVKDDLMWLIKTDESGKEQWNKKFGESGIFGANSVDQTADGGFILSGMTSPYGVEGPGGAWIIKTDAKGNKQWDKTIAGDIFGASSAYQTSDGGYIVTGMKPKLVKIDQNGKEEWSKTFQRKGLDGFSSVQETSGGGYVIAGSTQSYGADDGDAWLIKTDTNGNELWNKTYGKNIDIATSAKQISEGGYIITGWGIVIGTSDEDAWLIKTDENGNEEWNMTFAGPRADRIYSIQNTSDGGYILAGGSESYRTDGSDVWLIKVGNANKTASSEIVPSNIKPSGKTMSGFEISLTIFSTLIIFLLKRKKI